MSKKGKHIFFTKQFAHQLKMGDKVRPTIGTWNSMDFYLVLKANQTLGKVTLQLQSHKGKITIQTGHYRGFDVFARVA